MKILVTGGAGFIGIHLCKRLLDMGHEVICMDDFSTSWLHSEVDKLRRNRRFSFMHHDVQHPFDVNCDQIYHLACPASPVHYQRDPVRTIKTAFLGTMNALQNAKNHDARMLITSTSEVYGDPSVNPQPETYFGNVNTLGIRASYDEGKRAGEALAFSWVQQYQTDVRIARLFNSYGPFMASGDGRLLPNLISQALSGRDLTVYGTGEQTRSFCYVEDTIRGLMLLMGIHETGSISVVNIGNPDERSIISMATMVIELTRSESKIVFEPLPGDDPKQRCPDISKAISLLGWRPQVGLYDGLNLMIKSFKENRL